MDGVKDYLRRIGVNPDIYTRAAAEHGRVLDHYDDHGVPYEVIVGGGVPTIGAIAINYGAIDDLEVTWVSGDKTVPKFSAAMDTPRDRLHVVCGLEHVPITSDPQTTRLMDDYLIRATPMRDAQADCDWTAHELTIFHPDQLTPLASASQAGAPRVVSGGAAYTLADAEKAELVQVITFGGSTKVVADGASDVRVELPAGSAVALRDLSPKGAGPQRRLTGAMTLDLDAGTVRGGKKAAKDTTPPRTTAKLAPRQARPQGPRRRRDLPHRQGQDPPLHQADRDQGHREVLLRRRLGQRRDPTSDSFKNLKGQTP